MISGSPGQLSPTSSIYSNGPAPTIPSAPISPTSSRGGDDPLDRFNFDFNSLNINDLTQNMQNLTQNMQNLTNGLHKNFRGSTNQQQGSSNRYRSEYKPAMAQKQSSLPYGHSDRPSSAGPYSQPYSNGDYDPYRSARSRSSLGMYNEPSQHTNLYEARIKSPTPADNSRLRAGSSSPYGTNKVAAPSRRHTDSLSTEMRGKKSYPL